MFVKNLLKMMLSALNFEDNLKLKKKKTAQTSSNKKNLTTEILKKVKGINFKYQFTNNLFFQSIKIKFLQFTDISLTDFLTKTF